MLPVNRGEAPLYEPGLAALIRDHGARLRATTDVAEAVHQSDATFVVVPSPPDARGGYAIDFAARAFAEIGDALRDGRDPHLVVLTSTVLPGALRHGLLPVLEAHAGRRVGSDLGLCYSPEFIALGSVIRDFLQPDFVLIGEHDAAAGDRLAAWYRRVLGADVPVARMSLENAELAKVAVNSYVTMKITFANLLAAVCERLPGGDVDAVTGALGLDRRIGARYLTGATGYGGPCFPRDNAALRVLVEALGVPADLIAATDAFNAQVAPRVAALARAHVAAGSTVAVLGLAYKPQSVVLDESQGLLIAGELARAGMRVRAYDPLVAALPPDAAAAGVVLAPSLEACVRDADAVIIANPDPAFDALSPALLVRAGTATVVIDCWRRLALALGAVAGVRYVPVGRGPADAGAEALAALWNAPR